MEKLNVPKPVETPISSHLAKGVKPIVVCVEKEADWQGALSFDLEPVLNIDNVENVDWYAEPSVLKSKGFLNAGKDTYVISTIGDANKFSERFSRCLGLVAVGKDKVTGKNISFLSHQDPLKILSKNKDEFIKDLEQRLVELKSKCEPGTIDSVIIGGTYYQSDDFNDVENRYVSSIKLLGEEVKINLGFEPNIINGPKTSNYEELDRIFYDNTNRRLYFVRPKINTDTRDFVASEVDKQKDKWT